MTAATMSLPANTVGDGRSRPRDPPALESRSRHDSSLSAGSRKSRSGRSARAPAPTSRHQLSLRWQEGALRRDRAVRDPDDARDHRGDPARRPGPASRGTTPNLRAHLSDPRRAGTRPAGFTVSWRRNSTIRHPHSISS
jgi:hypothetical protein